MGFWASIRSWLYSKPRREAGNKHPDLYDLDVKVLARELRLEDEARRLAEAGLPARDSTALSAPEEAVVQRVERARQDFVDWASTRLSVLNDALGRHDARPIVNRANEAVKNFEQRASVAIAELEPTVRSLADNAASLQAELDSFRQTHGLRRNSRHPTGAKTYFIYSIVIALVIVEGALNSFFFAQGLDTGLLGGFGWAAALAAMNVATAFALGKFFVRYIYHRSPALKAGGFLAVAVALAAMLGFGLVIGHARDSLVAGAPLPFKAAMDSLLSQPLNLGDLTSWLLFAISLFFGLLSLIDGLKSDDPYPGYGAISRHAEEGINEFEEELGGLRETLEALKQESLEQLDEDLNSAKASVARFESLIEDKRLAASRLTTALGNAENCMRALLREFRDKNEIYRPDRARPPYFNAYPQMQKLRVPDFEVGSSLESLREQRAAVDSLVQEVEALKGAIQASFNKQFDTLKPLALQFSRVESQSA